MENKLESADIVFLVKALSHIPDMLPVLLNIVRPLKAGALLVYMDSPFPCSAFSCVSLFLTEVYTTWGDSYHLNFHYSGLFERSNITECRARVKVFERYRRSYII
ncbi:hypothetical protein CEXT_405851 [Caerostris extrusa]|uniref:Uncharacterized protein n=1 Tax=Caerostris extrusa TaxID=172846 RepID=A0AAV4UND0_CAEEX|nr:hypothetical protein CEXT_405851 [Caerostris extrusa]